jgi:hypothetical protein
MPRQKGCKQCRQARAILRAEEEGTLNSRSSWFDGSYHEEYFSMTCSEARDHLRDCPHSRTTCTGKVKSGREDVTSGRKRKRNTVLN